MALSVSACSGRDPNERVQDLFLEVASAREVALTREGIGQVPLRAERVGVLGTGLGARLEDLFHDPVPRDAAHPGLVPLLLTVAGLLSVDLPRVRP